MAEIVNLTGSSFYGFGREVRYLDGINAETVTADATISALSGNILFLSGGTCNIDLPAEEISEGKWHLIKNIGTGVYTVRNDAGTTIVVLGAGESSYVACDGTDWRSAMDTSLTVSLDMDVALTGTGSGFDLAVTINHATQVAGGFDSNVTQLSTARSAGYAYNYRAKTTSLAGDTNGVPYAGLYVLAPTDGGGAVSHSGLYVEAGNDYSVFSLDNVRLAFGTGAAGVPDATMGWDATSLTLLPTVDDSAFILGNGTLNFDFKAFGNIATAYAEVDASASQVGLFGPMRARGFRSLSPRFELRKVFGERGKPGINANIQDANEAVRMIADPDFEVLGSNASSDDVTHYVEGGIKLETDGGGTDSVIILPHLDAAQTAWSETTWGTDKETEWECDIITGSNITGVTIWAGLKLTNTSVTATDNDQVMFRYQDTVNAGEWQAVYSIGGTDTEFDSNIVVATSTRYHLKITIDSGRLARFYINGVLVTTSTALTNAVDLIPYVGILEGAAAAKHMILLGEAISRVAG